MVVVDRQQIKQRRRALFGLNKPASVVANLEGPSSKADDADTIREITATVRAVGHNIDGGVIVTLDDGARWEQTDSVMLGRQPRPGSTVTIKNAAFGSFKMRIDNGPSMRAARLN
jgi:hypothetical protein